MKGSFYEFTDEGRRNLMRLLAIELSDEKIKEILRRDYREDMTIDEGIKFSLKIFKELLEKNFDLQRFDVGYVKTTDLKLVRLHGDDLKKYIK